MRTDCKSVFVFRQKFFGEQAKNGGVLGEEIFCPRAVGFFLPAAAGGGQLVRSDFVSLIYGLNSVK